MPAKIDAAERRRHVVEAAFRLIAAEGIGGVTLRRVAAEAGLNVGSVRHYFDDHEELLAAAAEEAGARMGVRLSPVPLETLSDRSGMCAVEAMQSLLEQVLPLDEDRTAEAIVVVELIVASRTRRVFAPVAARMARDLQRMIADALATVGHHDPDRGAVLLSALIGGLTVDRITPHGALAVDVIRGTLREQLRMLLAVPEHR